MLRTVLKRHTLIALLPWNIFEKDPDLMPNADQTNTSATRQESGWERVKQIYITDDFGRLSTEFRSIIQVTCMSSFIGCFYGGVVSSRTAYQDFIRRNQATTFESHFEAKKKLQDAVSLSFAKGAFKWGWRLALFTTMYMTVSTSLAAYRGKNGVIEHAVGGGVAGALYKFKLGPSGWAVGGGLGFTLGLFAGVVTNSLLKMTGMTMDEVRYWNYKWVEERSKAFDKQLKTQTEKEELQLLLEHNKNPENVTDISMLSTNEGQEKDS